MKSASTQYKEVMKRKIRNHGYMSVSVGVVNQEAQSDCEFTGDYEAWSNTTFPFDNRETEARYATLEQNYFICDGSMNFLPETSDTYTPFIGICTNDFNGSATISFGNIYEIKGMTIEFEPTCYPLKFQVISDERTMEYENDGPEFSCTDVLGATTSLTLIPLEMVGGEQRFRITKFTAGTGITFTNDDISEATYTEEVSYVSEDLPAYDFDLTVLNYDGNFDVDNPDSFINFFQAGQEVTGSVGLELDDGSIEWIPLFDLSLYSWESTRGTMNLTCKDKFFFMNDNFDQDYHLAYRTLYEQAETVLQDAGLEPDEYEIDESLRNIEIVNPMPIAKHSECLQLIANAGRCSLTQRYDGVICLTANFSQVIAPNDIRVSTSDESKWSTPGNVVYGSNAVYADMTSNFFSADGSMYQLPESGSNYLDTGFVSAEISDENGKFTNNPSITLNLEAGYVYYWLDMVFDGNPPHTLIAHTSLNGESVEDVEFTDLAQATVLEHEFQRFDTISFEFTETEPYNRVLIQKIGFGDTSDYVLTIDDMMEYPTATQEERIKEIDVRECDYEGEIVSFLTDDDGVPLTDADDDYGIWDEDASVKESEIESYVHYSVNPTGDVAVFENPLIHDASLAYDVAEWMGNYYASNISYEVEYRGDPRLSATDLIFMENEWLGSLQVEIESLTFSFNGAFSGEIEARRATGMTED